MQVVLISGLSGSGKSIALNVLEDAGYYCVDNLPAPLLSDLVGHLRLEGHTQAAVAVDMRGGSSIAALPPQLRKLEARGHHAALRLSRCARRGADPALFRNPPPPSAGRRRRHAGRGHRPRARGAGDAGLARPPYRHQLPAAQCAARQHQGFRGARRAQRAGPAVRVLRLQARHSARCRSGVRRALPAQSRITTRSCARSPGAMPR